MSSSRWHSRARPRPRPPLRAQVAVAVALALMIAAFGGAAPRSAGAAPSRQPVPVDPSVASDVAAGVRVPVIVQVAGAPDGAGEAVRGAAARQATTEVLRSLPGAAASGSQIGSLPMVATTVDAAGLDALRRDPRVLQVSRNRRHRADVSHTTNITDIGADGAWTAGYTGAGQTVAVVDTGVDTGHAFLAGKVVAEACYSSQVADYRGANLIGQSTASCPGATTVAGAVPTQSATGPGSGAPCPLATECEHGTHVAGIAVGGDGGSFSGVAPGAGLIALNVFSVFAAQPSVPGLAGPYPGCGGFPRCVIAWDSDIILGLSQVDSLRSTYAIAAVNLSLGDSSTQATACDSDPLAPTIGQLKSHGIAVVIAAGNAGDKNGLSVPACVSAAISVGATDPATDRVRDFSDSSPRLSLLAPGYNIVSSVLDSTVGSDGQPAPACPAPYGADRCAALSGTSMATPHVAGAIAVLRQARPGLGGTTASAAQVDAEVGVLRATGKLVTDTANGVITPRIQLDAAVAAAPPPPPGAGLPPSFPGAVAANRDGRLETFRTDSSGTVANIWQLAPNAGWSGWSGLGGRLSGPPTVTTNVDGRLELFGVDTSGRLTHSWQLAPGQPWSGWVPLGGQVAGGRFTVFVNVDGRLEIFAVSGDGVIRHSWQLDAGGGWSAWYPVGTGLGAQGISSIRQPDGRAVVVVVDAYGNAGRLTQEFAGGGGGPWDPVGSGLSGTPGLGINPDARLELFIATSDGTLYHQWQATPDGSWSGLIPIAGGFNGADLAVGRNADGRLEVFSSRADGTAVHVWQGPGGVWSGLAGLGQAAAPVSVQVDADGRLELFSPEGRTHDWQVAPNGDWSGWWPLP